MNKNIQFVLVEPSHPGNIGAVARAISTMGFDQLALVKPQEHPHPESRARSSSALEVLLNAGVYNELEDAVGDSSYVIGTTARNRRISVPVSSIRDMANDILCKAEHQKISIVFGPETSGLSNEEIDRCNHLVYIPSSEQYPSLNLSMAVQVVAYELKMAEAIEITETVERNLASGQELELFYEHLREVLLATGFLNPRNPKKLMRRLRALFNRAELDDNEVNILRGILASYQKPRK
ncbi:MAG: RNA methyltransferase [Gammaproteobacteria bacterium]